MSLPVIKPEEFADLFLHARPMLDVRAEVEFEQGAFPTSRNLPLLNNAERALVGTCYKQEGQQAAIALGNRLISGTTREERIVRWQEFVHRNPEAVVYCFRGGLRSQLVQRTLAETGVKIPLIEGGYKALRRFLLETLESLPMQLPFVVVTGRTGSGKTVLLNEVTASVPVIDLEGLANHRGSAFGKMPAPQPTQINFENSLAIEILKMASRPLNGRAIALEDESRRIGYLELPAMFFEKLMGAPLYLIEESVEERVEFILNSYLSDKYGIHAESNAPQSLDALEEDINRCVKAISRRLGGLRAQQCLDEVKDAMAEHRRSGSREVHRVWIRRLLVDYYDPYYDAHIERQKERIVFRGTRNDVRTRLLG